MAEGCRLYTRSVDPVFSAPLDWYLTILSAVLAILLAAGIGAAARWLNWLTHEADQSLLNITIRVLMPCFIFGQIAGNEQLRAPASLAIAPVVGFASMAVGLLVALWVGRAIGSRMRLGSSSQVRTFALAIGLYNYGYLPIPLTQLLFGDGATMGVLLVHNVGVELALWTVGVLVLSGQLGRGWWRGVVNPISVTIVLALAINFSGLYVHLPDFVLGGVRLLGQAAIPLSLVLVGATIADYVLQMGFKTGGRLMVGACLLRLVLLPALFLLAAWLLPVSIELKRVMVLQAAMPAAIFPIVMARHYGGDPMVALRVALGTTLVSFLTMPVWLTVGLWAIGLKAA